jgi:Flp pilus assembly protein TadB
MSRRLAWLGGLAGGGAIWLLVGGWAGIGLGAVAAVVAARMLRRLESPSQRRDRIRVAADAPFAADLLAATLRSGAPTEHGLRTVGTAIGGVLGRRMVRVADGLRLGLEPVDAWAALRVTAESARLGSPTRLPAPRIAAPRWRGRWNGLRMRCVPRWSLELRHMASGSRC